jgi:hypothetical protein
MLYHIKTRRMANYLMSKGCQMVRIDVNKMDSNTLNRHLLMFVFKKDDHLYECVKSWKTDKDTYVCDVQDGE